MSKNELQDGESYKVSISLTYCVLLFCRMTSFLSYSVKFGCTRIDQR